MRLGCGLCHVLPVIARQGASSQVTLAMQRLKDARMLEYDLLRRSLCCNLCIMLAVALTVRERIATCTPVHAAPAFTRQAGVWLLSEFQMDILFYWNGFLCRTGTGLTAPLQTELEINAQEWGCPVGRVSVDERFEYKQ
jgi:hypothetical protein